MASFSFPVMPESRAGSPEPVPTIGYDYDHRHELMRIVWQRIADLLRDQYGIVPRSDAVASPAVERAS